MLRISPAVRPFSGAGNARPTRWPCPCDSCLPAAGDCSHVFIAGVLALGGGQLLARALVVAAQHVGIALVVQDLGRRPEDADGLAVGAVGEIEAAQAVVGRGQARARPRRRADAARPRGGNISRPARNYWRGIASCRGSRSSFGSLPSRPGSAAAGTPSGGGASALAASVAGAAAKASAPGVFDSNGLENLSASCSPPATGRPPQQTGLGQFQYA